MELLLHYIWKHRIYPLHEMRTNKGELIDVIDPGLHNLIEDLENMKVAEEKTQK